MVDIIEKTPFSRWYEKNAEALSEKRKARYKNDPEYRAKCLDRKTRQRALTAAEAIDPKYTHPMKVAAAELGTTLWTIRSLRDKGLIPEPYFYSRGFHFTAAQVESLRPLIKMLSDSPQSLAQLAKSVEFQDACDLIRANWS
jgi:hypothetical protein